MCMLNSYQILTGKKTYEDMLDSDKNVYLVFNPSMPLVAMDDDVYDFGITSSTENVSLFTFPTLFTLEYLSAIVWQNSCSSVAIPLFIIFAVFFLFLI